MDKNTIIGFGLIFVILLGFSWLNKPSEEQIVAQQRMRDSIAQVENRQQQLVAKASTIEDVASLLPDSIANDSTHLVTTFGEFAPAGSGVDTVYNLQNEKLAIQFAAKGGRIMSVRLREYQRFDSTSLILFNESESYTNYTLITANNRIVNTADMYFTPKAITDSSIVMSMSAGDARSFDISYTISPNDYMVKVQIKANNLGKVLASNVNYLDMNWNLKMRQQEKGRKFENRYANLYFKYTGDEVDYLSESTSDTEDVKNQLKWIAYKDQFFSSVMIADDSFTATKLMSNYIEDDHSVYLKEFETKTAIAFDPTGGKQTALRFYFGPNHYPTLKGYDKDAESGQELDIEALVPMGYSILRWINVWVTIPMFNFLGSFISNYGIIILIMTLIIKLVTSPLTFKSYMSSARMRAVKPMIDELNEKYPGQDNALKRQQETMNLYKRAGINPMSGCIPMLLQMPILIALFTFFPSSIELRQQPFLWATDLSTYDAIISWETNIPLISSFMGNHISLFCLLMTIVNIAFSKYNMDMGGGGNSQQMPGMKMMVYMMPIVFFFLFNQYSSGLSWYYLVSTVFSIVQTFVTKRWVDDEKILAQLKLNMKKPVKKSGWMARVEEMQKQQQKAMKDRAKNSKR